MRREVWFKEDLGQVLLAVGEANRSACGAMLEPRAGEREEAISLAQAYQAGFEAALHSLALAFGLLDVAGSLPRSWVRVLEEEPAEGVWSRVLEPGVAARTGKGDGPGAQWEVAGEWMEE